MGIERKKALILLNGTAGIGKAGLNTWAIIKKFAENGYQPVVYPIIPGTDLIAESLLAEYDGSVDIIFCSGGDGTLNHVVQGLMHMQSAPVLAYIPSGSTNDFSRTLRIPVEFDKALDAVFTGKPFRYDVGCLNGRYFNYVAAFGAFSAISYATDQQLKNILGHLAYIVNAVSGLDENIHYSRHLRIETDRFTVEDDFIFGAICNSAYVAGFAVFRESDYSLDDGMMEMLFIKAPETAADLQGILYAFQRGTMDHPLMVFARVFGASITSSEEVAWTVDGEYGGTYRETEFRVERKAVAIMRGSAAPEIG